MNLQNHINERKKKLVSCEKLRKVHKVPSFALFEKKKEIPHRINLLLKKKKKEKGIMS